MKTESPYEGQLLSIQVLTNPAKVQNIITLLK